MCEYCAVDGSCGHGAGADRSAGCACSLTGPPRCAGCDHDCVLWFSSLEIPGHSDLASAVAESADQVKYPASRDELLRYVSKSSPDHLEEIRWMEQHLPPGQYPDPGAVLSVLGSPVEFQESADTWIHPVPLHAVATGTRLVVGASQRVLLVDGRGRPCDTFSPGTVVLSVDNAPRAAAVSRPIAPGFGQTALDVQPVFFSTRAVPANVTTSASTRSPGIARLSVRASLRVDAPQQLLPLLPRPLAPLGVGEAARLLESRGAEWLRQAATTHDLSELRSSPSIIEDAVRAGARESGLQVESIEVSPAEEGTPADLADQRMQRMATMPNLPPEVAARIQAHRAAIAAASRAAPGSPAPPSPGASSPGSSVLCPRCQAPNPPTGKFCGNCGGPLAVKRTCARCQQELAPAVKFCGNCGAPVT